MLRSVAKFGCLFSLFATLSISPLAQTTSPGQQPSSPSSLSKETVTHHRSGNKKVDKQPEPEVPQTPLPPPTPEQLPPAQPNVSYQNGQLSITSENSTLAQILRSVQAKTGASVEIPGSANNDRVVAQLGPGAPRDVLNSLLNGSKFDYIILGVSDNPGAVQKVILTPRQNANTSQMPVSSAQAGPPPPAQAAEEVQPEDDSSYVPEPQPEENQPEQNGQAQPVPSFIPAQPMQQGTQPNGPAPVMPNGGPAPGTVGPQQAPKTPEQLLQELQRMQQMQQQYQQQLNPANQQQPEQPQQQ